MSTAGLALNTWRVRLYFSSSLLQYVRFEQSSHFNSATPSESEGELSWLATGLKSTTSEAEVNGEAIYLLRVFMRVSNTVIPGTYDGTSLGLYPRATELISGAAFLLSSDGQIFDSRGSIQTRGRLEVAGQVASGILAYFPSGTLANLAPLTLVSSSHPLMVIQFGSDDRHDDQMSIVNATNCSTAEPSTVLALSDCNVLLGQSQTASKASAAISVSHGGMHALVTVTVYAPQSVSIMADNTTLNRFATSSGESLTKCTSGGRSAFPYQRTRVHAFADGLDATHLVSFGTADADIVAVSSARQDVVEGRQAGTTTLHLSGGGQLSSIPTITLDVTDTLVFATELVTRVITTVRWAPYWQPQAEYVFGQPFRAVAEVSNVMTAEGHGGYMFSRVRWSDGHEEDVGYSPVGSVEELGVVSRSNGVVLTDPSAGETFWHVAVAVGALRECVSSVAVDWSVCGHSVASGMLPLYLELPDATAASVAIVEERLTPVGNDAGLEPIGVPTSSQVNT